MKSNRKKFIFQHGKYIMRNADFTQGEVYEYILFPDEKPMVRKYLEPGEIALREDAKKLVWHEINQIPEGAEMIFEEKKRI